jgi:translation initiation factor 1A
MPKNLKGGKQFKRKAKDGDDDLSIFTIDRQEGQQIARAIKLLGNRNVMCYCNDNNVRVCHIRGKMRGRVFIDVGDIVLISLRDFELGLAKDVKDLNGDILAKYPYECLTRLKKENGINPKLFMQLEVLNGTSLSALGTATTNTIEGIEDGFEFDRDKDEEDSDDSDDDSDVNNSNKNLDKGNSKAKLNNTKNDDDDFNIDDI